MTGVGIALLLAGVVLLVAEAHIAAAGLLGALGTAAAVAGTVLAVEGAGGGLALTLALALAVALVAGGWAAVVVRAVARSSHGQVRSGRETLLGSPGRARGPISAGEGRALVDGALWRARNVFPEEPIDEGDPVVVVAVEGLTLTVRRAESWELNP